MVNGLRFACLAAMLAACLASEAKQPRSHSVRAEFQRANPCPSTGERRGPCPGYVVDHVMPLCAGGVDHQSNMQWQSIQEAKIKDRDERKMCHDTRRHVRPSSSER